MDKTSRRYHQHPVAEANENNPMGSLEPKEFYTRHGVSHSSSFFVNAAGLKIFTQAWMPLPPTKPIGIIHLIHGYTGDSSYFIELTAVYFAKVGFAACAIDLQGHGHSQGLAAHIPDIRPVVEDCTVFFNSFYPRPTPSEPKLPRFLYAESFGGAIALLLLINLRTHQNEKALLRPYDGLILNGAMCGISKKFKPPYPLEHILCFFAAIIPKWPVVPTRGNVVKKSLKMEWKRRLAVSNPRRYKGSPRTATAYEMLRLCKEVQKRCGDVVLPLLILHGGDDGVCDPASAEKLHRRVGSEDKTMKIYPGMWHQLVGENDDDVDLVFGDILDWLLLRVTAFNVPRAA
ncbi:Alpha/beta-Hydrolases superfamily protein [Zostera marina]|uniref:Alpha/beta-Hydrolases superfamily protein n=1 Tax=Zostera marina TaxID=29655 RepID=A0A0K9NNN8_ZOSMR|nr:Alpha/beta-Hydrolases superfamily protein [Zostera marina]